MDLAAIQRFQEEFDKKHGWGNKSAAASIKKLVGRLLIQTVCLAGEVGEFANEVKKLKRDLDGGFDTRTKRLARLKEELVDIFIYLIKLSLVLNLDLERAYFAKMAKNEKRFKKFEKTPNIDHQ